MASSDDFFDEKRPWSRIKDQILGDYLNVYLAKINKRRRSVVLVDGFAGQGRFGSGEEGSPLMMARLARDRLTVRYRIALLNNKQEDHDALKRNLVESGLDDKCVIPILGDSNQFLLTLAENMGSSSILLYLDPYGLSVSYETLLPYLKRSRRYSTEIIINMSMAGTHRLAARRRVAAGEVDEAILANHDRMTSVFGGEYWKDIYFTDREASEKESTLMATYLRDKIAPYLKYHGFCPVKERLDSQTKYFVAFASDHEHAYFLMNNFMCNSFNKVMHDQFYEQTLFAGQTDWRDLRSRSELKRKIQIIVEHRPGIARLDVWRLIIGRYFMQFHETEFTASVEELVDEKVVRFESKTGRLNPDAKLYLSEQPGLSLEF